MDRGVYLQTPSHLQLSHPEIPHGFDEHPKNTATCLHTHTCNAPSVALHHTHTHAHTQVVASDEEPRNPRKPLGNREAVRKYREKKKAHTAFLEEEVRKLRAANQQLLRRLQGHAALEAEVMGLTSLLLDVRGKIDAEIGAPLPCHKQCGFGSTICADHAMCYNTNTDTEEVAAREDREFDESGMVSGEVYIPQVANSVRTL